MAVVWPEKDRPMTRTRALKRAIRSRAAATGERYTTARRHVVSQLKAIEASRAPVEAPRAVSPARARTGISEAQFVKKTGHGFDHWFAVLDRFGAVEKGHTAAARHLFADHGVPGWHAQGLTVAYERARGVRAANQRCDGVFEVSVSKVVAASVPAIVKALSSPRSRARLKVSDPGLLPALAKGLEAPKSTGFVVRPDGLGRFRYQWDATTVQFYLAPKPGGKTSVVVTHMKLADARAVEQRRAVWREVLNALASVVTK
jgi:hypothetical protein